MLAGVPTRNATVSNDNAKGRCIEKNGACAAVPTRRSPADRAGRVAGERVLCPAGEGLPAWHRHEDPACCKLAIPVIYACGGLPLRRNAVARDRSRSGYYARRQMRDPARLEDDNDLHVEDE